MKNKVNEKRLVMILVIFFCLLTPFAPFQKAWATGWVIEAVEDVNHGFSNVNERAVAVDQLGRPHIAYGGNHLYHAYFDGVQWQLEEIDRSPQAGYWVSMAIDSNNRVHIVYSSELGLTYATNAQGTWAITSVGWGVVQEMDSTSLALALDTSGKIHMSYFEITRLNADLPVGNLKYATNASGSWETTILDADVDVGHYTSIAVDGEGKVHISYASIGLNYATNASGSWVSTIVDNAQCVYNSIAADTLGSIHISYISYAVDEGLKYATNTSGSWISVRVDDYGKGNTSIAVDDLGSAHVSYISRTGQGGLSFPTYYATNVSGSWVTTMIEDGGWDSNSIALDASGNAYVGYYANGNIKFATNVSGAWVVTTVDGAVDVGWFDSIALDPSAKAHISYVGSGSKEGLRYATNASGAWVTTTVDHAPVGDISSMVLDPSGNGHIAYQEVIEYNWVAGAWAVFKYATNKGGMWDAAEIGGPGFVGQYPSLILDPSGNVHISHYDGILLSWDLKYTTNASGMWEAMTIDTPVGVGGDSSLALDGDGNLHVSYVTDRTLKYATTASGASVTESVDSTGWFRSAKSISMALDASGGAHISYANNADNGLRYATNTSGSSVTTQIDSGDPLEFRGLFSSIALDADGNTHISYVSFGDLKYATNRTNAWVTTAIDSGARYTSIALDPAGDPHISYYDVVNYTLKYAHTAHILDLSAAPDQLWKRKH